jgi:hypothetical protein
MQHRAHWHALRLKGRGLCWLAKGPSVQREGRAARRHLS